MSQKLHARDDFIGDAKAVIVRHITCFFKIEITKLVQGGAGSIDIKGASSPLLIPLKN